MFRNILTKLSVAGALLAPCLASALPTQYYSQESKLASGRWVKIKVTQTGMQQITFDQLREWGFSNPEQVSVYGYGGVVGYDDRITSSLPDDLPRQLSVTSGDRILFYGESNYRLDFGYLNAYTARQITPMFQRNNAAEAGYYFITDSRDDSDTSPAAIPYSAGDGSRVYTYHRSIGGFEEEFDNPFRCGQIYFGHDFSEDRSISFTFPMPDRYTDSDDGNAVYVFPLLICGDKIGYFDVNINGESSRTPVSYINDVENYLQFGHNLPQSSSQTVLSRYIKTPEIAPDENTLRVDITAEANYSYASLDNLTFYYPRKNILRGAQLMITDDLLPGGAVEQLSEASDRIQVWDVHRPQYVVPYETSFDPDASTLSFSINSAYNASTSTGYGFRAVAFDPDATDGFYSVEYAGEVSNQNLHALPTPDLVIITTDMCRVQAERLARLHRDYLKQDVIVLSQEEIFNEFSSGTPSNMGIRRLVKMFYDRGVLSAIGSAQSKMRSLLFFGGGMYDNRAFSSMAKAFADQGALTLTYGTKDHSVMVYTTKSYTTDAYYGMVEDNTASFNIRTAQQQVSVGRIPAYNDGDAITAVDKIEQYLQNPPTFDVNHRALIITDSGDVNSHMANGEGVAKILETYSPGITNIKVYSALYELSGTTNILATNAIAEALKNGVGFFTYSGHGKPDWFSRHKLWSTSNVLSTDYSYYPVAMLATCHGYAFDLAVNDISSEMLFKSNGGMIGVIGHGRKAYQSANQVLNEKVAKVYSNADTYTLTGDLYRMGRNELIKAYSTSVQYLDNTLCYNYGGDPALPLYAPDSAMTITGINGTDVSASGAIATIESLVSNKVEGFIGREDDPSVVDESFNGHVHLSLYESPTTRRIIIHPLNDWTARDTSDVVRLDQDLLSVSVGTVVNGRFSVNFSSALPLRKGDYNRMTLYAYSDDYSRYVSTFTTKTVIKPSQNSDYQYDTTPPSILKFYIDSPDFRSGDLVSNNFTLYALIGPDESGIRSQAAGIGAATRVVLDGRKSILIPAPNIKPQPDGTTLITFPVTTISDGRHEMLLNVADNVGNTSSTSIEFVVINEPAKASLAIAERPARTQATISLDHTFGQQPEGRLVIEDADGNTVHTVENCAFPYEWDLFDAKGNPVADGLYTAYAILKSGLQYAATPRAEILVLQK